MHAWVHSLVLISHVLACCMCVHSFLHGIEIRVRSLRCLLPLVIISLVVAVLCCSDFLCGSIISAWGAACHMSTSFLLILFFFSLSLSFLSSLLLLCICVHVCVCACMCASVCHLLFDT